MEDPKHVWDRRWEEQPVHAVVVGLVATAYGYDELLESQHIRGLHDLLDRRRNATPHLAAESRQHDRNAQLAKLLRQAQATIAGRGFRQRGPLRVVGAEADPLARVAAVARQAVDADVRTMHSALVQIAYLLGGDCSSVSDNGVAVEPDLSVHTVIPAIERAADLGALETAIDCLVAIAVREALAGARSRDATVKEMRLRMIAALVTADLEPVGGSGPAQAVEILWSWQDESFLLTVPLDVVRGYLLAVEYCRLAPADLLPPGSGPPPDVGAADALRHHVRHLCRDRESTEAECADVLPHVEAHGALLSKELERAQPPRRGDRLRAEADFTATTAALLRAVAEQPHAKARGETH